MVADNIKGVNISTMNLKDLFPKIKLLKPWGIFPLGKNTSGGQLHLLGKKGLVALVAPKRCYATMLLAVFLRYIQHWAAKLCYTFFAKSTSTTALVWDCQQSSLSMFLNPIQGKWAVSKTVPGYANIIGVIKYGQIYHYVIDSFSKINPF